MLTFRALVLRYALFAIMATVSNVASQAAGLAAYSGPQALPISILFGTAMGFAVKYLLDKRFIFFDRQASASREIAEIVLYGMTAVTTTLIFWSFELGFWEIWPATLAKYIGVAIGLGIGYIAKYALDRRFMFIGADLT